MFVGLLSLSSDSVMNDVSLESPPPALAPATTYLAA